MTLVCCHYLERVRRETPVWIDTHESFLSCVPEYISAIPATVTDRCSRKVCIFVTLICPFSQPFLFHWFEPIKYLIQMYLIINDTISDWDWMSNAGLNDVSMVFSSVGKARFFSLSIIAVKVKIAFKLYVLKKPYWLKLAQRFSSVTQSWQIKWWHWQQVIFQNLLPLLWCGVFRVCCGP